MKVLLLNTISVGVIRFRKPLIQSLLDKGHEVYVACADNIYINEIEKMGCRFVLTKIKNRSINPFHSLCYKRVVRRVVRTIKPNIIFAFQLKPNTFGIMAIPKKQNARIFAMVEGAGDPFSKRGIKWAFIRRIVCLLYKKSFKKCEKVFFLNNEDKKEFITKQLVSNDQAIVILGIGVNLDRFSFKPINRACNFLMIARMQKAKGVLTFCKVARIVKKVYPQASFNYLGSEGDIKLSEIKEYVIDHSINYCGEVDDVRPYLEQCTMLLLPSTYREGIPMSIMEAEAVGRGIIAFDNVGCRDVVIDGYNGFLIEKNNIHSFAEKCIEIIKNHQLALKMGENARDFAAKNLDCNKINPLILDIILN